MNKRLILDESYKEWIGQLSIRYRNAQIKAAIAVNKEMIKFYWELGRDIVSMNAENKYGSKFFDKLSRDLKSALPDAKGFSPKSLYYIKRFYLMYSKNFPQLGGNSEQKNQQEPETGFQNFADGLFNIPWAHHKLLIYNFHSKNVIIFQRLTNFSLTA